MFIQTQAGFQKQLYIVLILHLYCFASFNIMYMNKDGNIYMNYNYYFHNLTANKNHFLRSIITYLNEF